MKKRDEGWAVFWCSLMRPLLFGEVEDDGTNRFLKDLSEKEVLHPNGKRKRPSLSTLRRKFRKYRRAGFDGLARKTRKDRGEPRAVSKDVIERAVQIKRDLPTRSPEAINKFIKDERGMIVPRSTLYRHLKNAGATRIKLGVTANKVRKRWTRDRTHDLWLGDFEEGPYVLVDGQAVPAHLSAFIDCHSRSAVCARYYFRQNLDILIDTLLRAWAIHGLSSEIYLDNAKVYHSNGLKAACFRLNIRLIHRTARDAPPGGLIERFFETVQDQFETEVRAGNIMTIEDLNRAFSAWLEMSYHRRVHSETGQTPHERYKSGLTVVRRVDIEEAARSFMKSETRRVDRVFSDIRLNGRFYRVDRRLRGDKVDVRYDPYSSMETVLLYSLKDEYLGRGELHNREKGDAPGVPPPPGKVQYSYLDLLVRQHEEEIRKKTGSIDYRKITERKAWSFPAFARAFGRLLGRKGCLSAFSAGELERLRKMYNHNAAINEPMLQEAFEKAGEKNISRVLQELGRMAIKKEE